MRSAGQIVDLAKARKADVIVMTTQGYSRITHLVAGSVAERVVRNAVRPVMVDPAERPVLMERHSGRKEAPEAEVC